MPRSTVFQTCTSARSADKRTYLHLLCCSQYSSCYLFTAVFFSSCAIVQFCRVSLLCPKDKLHHFSSTARTDLDCGRVRLRSGRHGLLEVTCCPRIQHTEHGGRRFPRNVDNCIAATIRPSVCLSVAPSLDRHNILQGCQHNHRCQG
jgi:hypothetical protein